MSTTTHHKASPHANSAKATSPKEHSLTKESFGPQPSLKNRETNLGPADHVKFELIT
jgi:hypothetical protein